jgi:TolB protein
LSRDILAFDSNRAGNYEVYATQLSGARRTWQLTSDGHYDSWWARLSPDRMRLLFYRTPKGIHDRDFTTTTLWVMNADGSAQRQLRAAKTDGWLIQGHGEWSPDGRSMVMTGTAGLAPQLFITDADGMHPRQLTHLVAGANDPSWAPDGETVVFYSCPGSTCSTQTQEIYTIAVATGQVKRLTYNSIPDNDPYYSPDGKSIAWLGETSAQPAPGVWNVYTMNADGSGQRNLTNDRMINSKPQWSADGGRMFFHRFAIGTASHWEIYSIRPDGSGLTQVTSGQDGDNEYPTN